MCTDSRVEGLSGPGDTEEGGKRENGVCVNQYRMAKALADSQ